MGSGAWAEYVAVPEAALTPMPPNVSFERAATLGSLVTLASDKKMGMLMWRVNPSRDMAYLAEQLESGAIEPLIDRTYPLAETPDAMRYLETGEARGKIVITT